MHLHAVLLQMSEQNPHRAAPQYDMISRQVSPVGLWRLHIRQSVRRLQDVPRAGRICRLPEDHVRVRIVGQDAPRPKPERSKLDDVHTEALPPPRTISLALERPEVPVEQAVRPAIDDEIRAAP